MATGHTMNDSIVGYIANISNENKKKKFYLKFSMMSKNDQTIDGWVFSNTAGILSTPLGIAMNDSLKYHSGLRLWGTLEEDKGVSVFKTQSYAKFQKANPDFLFRTEPAQILLVRDALICVETFSIRVYVVSVRPPIEFRKNSVLHTNTFVLIGDSSGTCYLAAIDLSTKAIETDKSYDLTQVRRKIFNGVPILMTTINTHIASSNTPVNADVSSVATTLALDLTDKKLIISSVEQIGPITRSTGCSTCKSELIDVTDVGALVYCAKCKRHSLKKNVNQDQSTTLIIKKGEEKVFLIASGSILEKLFDLANVSSTMTDTEIALAVLSSGEYQFEYSELSKNLINISEFD